MDKEETNYISADDSRLTDALGEDYYDQAIIHGIKCHVGYKKEFRLSWIATRLHLFIVIGKTDQKIDKNLIENFSKESFQYALEHNTGWRGFQSCVAVIAILEGTEMENEALMYCMQSPPKHWGACEIPVIYDRKNKTAIRYSSIPMWGAIYYPHFNKKIKEVTDKLG